QVPPVSAQETAKACGAPATGAVGMGGKVTNRKVCNPAAPGSRDASSSDGDTRRRRASTLLNTSTMQNVVWPTITVRIDRSVPVKRKNDASATPVMTPGRMIGRVTAKLTGSRPGKRKRAKAKASAVPSTSANAVENSAIRTDSHAASLAAPSWASRSNQRVEKPGNGHALIVDLLKA